MTCNAETFGDRLYRLRVGRGLTQRQLAESVGVSYAYVSRLETGGRRASMKAVRQFASGLGVSPHYLEFGFEDPNEEALLRAAAIIRQLLEERRVHRRLIRSQRRELDELRGGALNRDLTDAAREAFAKRFVDVT